MFGGLGGVNVLALGVVSYWGYKKYAAGENVWKVIGIAAGAWVGLSALEFLGVRYVPNCIMKTNVLVHSNLGRRTNLHRVAFAGHFAFVDREFYLILCWSKKSRLCHNNQKP